MDAAVAVDGGAFLAADLAGHVVYAPWNAAESGWTADFAEGFRVGPVLAGDLAVVVSDGGLLAVLERASGALRAVILI